MSQPDPPEPSALSEALAVAANDGFVRFLERTSRWKQASENQDLEKAKTIFTPAPNCALSLFRLSNATSLRRIIVANDVSRGGRREKPHLLAILPDEFAQAEVSPEQTRGTLGCAHADEHHFEVRMDDKQIEHLVRLLWQNKREPGKYTPSMVKQGYELSKADGCHVLPESQGDCRCLSE